MAEGVDSGTKFLEVNLTEKVIDQHPSHQKEYLFERNKIILKKAIPVSWSFVSTLLVITRVAN